MPASILSTNTGVLAPPRGGLRPMSPAADEQREFGDAAATRRVIYDQVLQAAQGIEPVQNQRHTLRLSAVKYAGPETFSYKDEKDAILAGKTLGRRLVGQWDLVDNATGKILSQRQGTVARVPYMTDRGTFIHNGTEYTLSNQLRLRPGIFTRVKDNGEIEAHANILPGKGVSHRYFLDPAHGVFFLRIGQAKMPLMSLLRTMGATDSQLQKAWGGEIYQANAQKDDPGAITKLYQRLIRSAQPDATEDVKRQSIKDFIEKMEMDGEVNKSTLGEAYSNLNLDSILATTRKLLAVSRGEQEVDDRDHLAYQTAVGPEDLLSERIAKDYGGIRRNLLFRASFRGNLDAMPSGALTKQLEAALLNSGLGMSLEEINPLDIFDKQSKISRLGEGGIPSIDSVPDEARSVQPSHLGFMDPVRTPESFKVGVDVHIANKVRKGRDGRLYAPFTDPRTGQIAWRSPQDLQHAAITFPGELAKGSKRVAAMQDGKLKFVKRRDVDLVLPEFENAFSSLGAMIPMKSAVKAQRMAMASRMLTQALPLSQPDAPLVQSGTPDDPTRSFEDLYGAKTGAVVADQPGRVVSVSPHEIKIKYADGSVASKPLYHFHPYNRKTYLHNTPLVQPGQAFDAGAVLAKSNYTTDGGTVALGKNLRAAYIPFRGLNFEDANVISESAAQKLSSEHMYQHGVEWSDEYKQGKKNFVSMFAGKFDRKTLANIDDDGAVKVGTVLNYGDPLILAARRKEQTYGKIHRKRQASFADASEVWNHHSPGEVTDVFKDGKNTTVLVRSISPMQVGDKMSGRYGDKGIISAIIPDDEMPRDSEGRPFEVLLNPLGIISRCYDEQTEFLTDVGWLRGRDVRPEHKLMQFDPQTHTLRLGAQVAPMYEQRYVGTMYGVAAKHVDFLVTPQHKMWARSDFPESEWQETTAERIYGHRWWVPTAGYCVEEAINNAPEPFCLPQIRYSKKDTRSDKSAIEIDAFDWAEFLGWYVAEGHTVFNKKRREYKVFIAQSQSANFEKCQKIAALLARLPFRWFYKHSTQQFVISSKRLAAYTKELGVHAYEKHLPDWIFSQPLLVRERCLTALWLGDGHSGQTSTGLTSTLGSTSSLLIDQIQILCILSGKAAIKRPVAAKLGSRPMWRCAVQLMRSDRQLLPKHWYRLEYDGYVYCPTVETGYVLTRRNGKLLSAGNTNPAQMVEAALGKIAAVTGKPYKVQDFKNIDDLTEYALDELRKHNMRDLEDVIDPETDRKIPNIFTGTRFFMKLHHTAEGKGQGRGIGGYTMDDTPAKGGETGCFVASQVVITDTGPVKIGTICEKKLGLQVLAYDWESDTWAYRPITNWFCYRARTADLIKLSVIGPCYSTAQHHRTRTASKIVTTRQHEFYRADGTRILAGDLSPGDCVATRGVWPTEHQWQVMLGSLLGDAYVTQSGFGVEHSLKQRAYLDWKQSLLGGLGGRIIVCDKPQCFIRVRGIDVVKKRLKSGQLYLPETEYGRSLRELCYCDDKKTLNAAWLSQLTPLSMAVWFLDDGTLHNKGRLRKFDSKPLLQQYKFSGAIYAQSFEAAEVEQLCDLLQQFYGIRGTRSPKHNWINLNTRLCRLLVAEVARWVPWKVIPRSKGFLRKLVRRLQSVEPPQQLAVTNRLTCIPMRVESIECYRSGNDTEVNVYDITVDGLHNYCAGPALVSNSKVLSLLDNNALLSHGATQVLRDAGAIRGQRNEEFWLRFMQGLPPPKPKVPIIYEKFLNELRGSGIHVVEDGPSVHIMALTNKDIDRMAGGRYIQNSDTVQFEKGMKPVTGGLFDPALTGGNDGRRWAAIKLHEPMPNPVMEEPIRRILGLTQKRLEDVLAGRARLHDSTGPSAIKRALETVNLDKEIEVARAQIKSGRKTARDEAVRKLGYLKSAKKLGIHPGDWMWSQVPVLPPRFRPVSVMADSGQPLVADANYLYKELIEANDNLAEMSKEVDDVGEERLATYNAMKAVTGLGDPVHPKYQEKGVRGLLKHIFGSSPKLGAVQRRLISSTVDLVGRAVIAPDPALDMDHVGLPESRAWDVYKNFIVRRLKRRGMPLLEAAKQVEERTELARNELLQEMENRPVIINRAPVLHRFGIMAFYPKLVKGDTLKVSPLIVGGFNADFDGDAMQYHVPVAEEARQEAIERMLPSRNLLSPSDFQTPMHKPSQEYTGGLYAATSQKSSRHQRTFRSIKDVLAAYRRGEIDISDPVEVLT